MDIVKGKWKKNLIIKAWGRCKSLGSGTMKSPKIVCSLRRSKSWHCTNTSSSEEDNINKRKKKFQVAPSGCFSVYVGPEKQRFVVKTEFANHPLFKLLLEDAELECGFNIYRPILLPCDVDLFYKILAEMENNEDEIISSPSWSPLILCSTPNSGRSVNKGYKLLSPSRLLKLNHI